MCISSSVGRNGSNKHDDVKTVQILINMSIGKLVPLAPLEADGGIGSKTITAIEEYQRRVLSMPQPDGRVDPNGTTLKKLREGVPDGFTAEKLQGIMIHATPSNAMKYAGPLHNKMVEYGIDTPLRMAHFLAQLAHESAELRYSEEIASGAAYEGRVDLGNTETGDGKRFKGRGLIQLTGRSNYTAYGAAKGVDYTKDDTASLIAQDPFVAVDVSCWFWKENALNDLADGDNVNAVTYRVNGGYNGLADRKAKLARAKFFLTR
jgi:putative chitinase